MDVFTDCPGRERAGWLCDSFFIGRVAADLCGNTDMERMFFQNYLLPEHFEALPKGMLPMCYPADHPNSNYIPNWAMWFVVQLEEYLHRSGDRATIDALKPRVLELLAFFKQYENSDGLLEKLPAWVFVEWSHANKLVQDVNYPSNMTYAEVLACVARMYDMPELGAKAEAVRETVRRQSYDGTYFVDNAKRRPDSTLAVTGERTETCQYYAFFFRTATPETHPHCGRVYAMISGRSGSDPQASGDPFLERLYRKLSAAGAALPPRVVRKILEETKGYFQGMEERTDTLGERHADCELLSRFREPRHAHVLSR